MQQLAAPLPLQAALQDCRVRSAAAELGLPYSHSPSATVNITCKDFPHLYVKAGLSESVVWHSTSSTEMLNQASFSLPLCSDLKGVIVTLSDDGHLQCSYLGTDPALFQAPKVESRELNYEDLDVELKELQKIIKDVKSQGVWPMTEREDDLKVSAAVSPNFDSVSQATDADVGTDLVPSITVKVTLQSQMALQKAKLSVYVQPPLALTCDHFSFDFMAPETTSTVAFSVYLKRSYAPSELEGNAVVSYFRPTDRNPDGIPRVIQCKFRLPLKLIYLPGQPSKTASHKLTIDTNKSPVSLLSLFPGRTFE
ncbi:protein PTHB1-like, partial [Octodon degus]|uniref:Protein PTHB1-like n=1 Tax=Octodon degus TaxID=10160 RepID=A0A6P3FMQ1_OCTDE